MQVKLITILWALITERNAVNAGERQKHPSHLSVEIQLHCSEFSEVLRKSSHGPVMGLRRWAKPSDGFLKENVDASFKEDSKSGGWGFVVRSENGDAVAAGAGHIQCVKSFPDRSNCVYASSEFCF